MPGKDPAALFYIANFLVATAEMKGDCTGWYTRLILHQFDKKSLPNDLEELANLANVRASEYDMFQQVWQQVLKQKFEVLPTGRLQDAEAAEIIRTREAFIDKRAASGRKSAFIKMIRRELCQDENVIHFIKTHLKDEQIETKDQHVLKEVYKQMFQLYINIDINKDRIDEDIGGPEEKGEGREGAPAWTGMPGPEHLHLALPEIKAGSVKLLMDLAGIKATDDQVLQLWEVFKVQNFTGKNWYSYPDDTYSHFINWSKTQKINGTSKEHEGANPKLGTSTARTEALRRW